MFYFIKHYSRGVTLVELMIVLAIFSVLMIVLVNFFVGYSNLSSYVQTTVDASESTGLFIAAASSAARQANKVLASYSFSGTPYASGATTMVLELPSVDSSGNTISGRYDYMAFYLSGTDIYWHSLADASSSRKSFTRKIGTSVQTLAFTYDSGDFSAVTKVNIDVRVQKQTNGQTIQSSLHQVVYLRNKQ